MQPAPDATDSQEKFEFSDAHNMVFDGLAKAAMVVAIVELILALASAVPGIMALVVLNTPIVAKAFIQVLVFAAMGLWTLRAAKYIKLIVSTEGDDIEHLMSAVREIRKLFLMQVVVFLVMLITVGLETAGMWVAGAAAAAP